MSKIVTVGATVLFAFLVSAVHFNVAQARTVALAAVNNFKNSAAVCQCSRTICASASKRAKEKFPQDAWGWRTMLCAVVRQTQCSIAKPPPGQSNSLGCLRTAKRVVSPQCNAALDTAYVR